MNRMMSPEWRLLTRDRLLWVSLAILLACIAFAARSGASYRAQWQQTALSLQQDSRAQLDQQIADVRANKPADPDAWSPPPGTPGSVKIAVPAAVPPLAHFSIGQSDLYPRSTETRLSSRADRLFKQYQIQSPLTLASGRFDLGYVVIAVLPLLAIVLCFDLLAADRVSGRLSLLAVQAGALGGLIARRLLLRGAVLSLPLIVLLIWGLLSGAALLPLLTWVGLALLYAAFWLLLCAVIALRPSPPETQAAQLVALWLLLVLALPAGINRLVETLAPPPSQQAFQATMREAEIRAASKSEELLKGYLSDHPELTVSGTEAYGDWMKKSVVVRVTVEAETEPLRGAHQAQIERARRVTQWLQFLSPAALLQVALSDAAGTGPEQHAAYVAAVRAYKTEIQARVVPPVYRALKLSAEELEALPEFVAPRWTPAHGGGLLGATALFLSGLCGLLTWRLRRAAAALSPITN